MSNQIPIRFVPFSTKDSTTMRIRLFVPVFTFFVQISQMMKHKQTTVIIFALPVFLLEFILNCFSWFPTQESDENDWVPIDNKQEEICHATSKTFHGYSVQAEDVMNKKKCWILPQSLFSAIGQSDIDWLFTSVHNARETKAWNGRSVPLLLWLFKSDYFTGLEMN